MRQAINTEFFALRFIKDKILAAEDEILISSSKFLTQELFEVLHHRAENGISIKMLIQDSHWFNKIERINLSHNFLVCGENIENHDTHFIIIDHALVIHSMEKWEVYSSRPSKGIIITDDSNTIETFTNRFHETFIAPSNEKESKASSDSGIFQWLNLLFGRGDSAQNTNHEASIPEVEQEWEQPSISEGINELDEILDSVTTVEIDDFNRDELRAIGESSAQSLRGNVEALIRMMDSLYSTFLRSIHIHFTQKENLKSKINLKVEELIHLSNQQIRRALAQNDKEKIAKEKEYNIELSHCSTEIEKCKLSIEQLETENIPEKEKEVQEKENEWIKLERENLPKTQPKWHEIGAKYVAYSVLPLGLLVFCSLFYASSAYNILFAVQDLADSVIQNATLFQPEFFRLASDKGIGALIPVLSFSLIPLGAALLHSFSKSRLQRNIWLISILSIDALVAFRVTLAVHDEQLKTLGKGTATDIGTMLLEFFTILIFGFAPLFIFKYMRKRWVNFHKESRTSDREKRMEIEKRFVKNEILFLTEELSDFLAEKKALHEGILDLAEQQKQLKINLSFLDAEIEKSSNAIREGQEEYIMDVKKRADIYKNGIDNNTIYLPLRALKDRLNVFLEGWNTWLYQEWAERKAEYYVHEANKAVDSWLSQNMPMQNQNIRQIANDQ